MADGVSLLSAVIASGGVTAFTEVRREDLIGPKELKIYDFILGHFREYGVLPARSTVEEETGTRLRKVDEPLDYYARKVADRAMFNNVRPLWAEIKDLLIENDAEAVRDKAMAIADQCRVHDSDNDLQTIGEVGETVIGNVRSGATKYCLSGVPTGYAPLDLETDGYQDGDLVFWVSRPSIGKTYMLLHGIKTAYMAGKSVLLVSMEMTSLQLANRFYGMYSGVDPYYIRRGKVSTYHTRRLQQAVDNLAGCNRFHMFAGNLDKSAAAVDQLIRELSPDIVYIDGVYLMKPSGNKYRQSKTDSISAVVDDLKSLTLTHNRPIICTSQINRQGGEGARFASLETIGYTDSISTHSSIICNITMPQGRNSTILDRKGRPLTRDIKVLKGREGEVGQFTTNYSFTPVDFSPLGWVDTSSSGEEGEGDTSGVGSASAPSNRHPTINRLEPIAAGSEDWAG